MLQNSVEEAFSYGRQFVSQGKVADYIPELGKADPNKLGIAVFTKDGKQVLCGDVDERFTIQSICKVISLAVALERIGFDEVFSHVMMEPSGDAFNSLIKLDTASDRPYNPMINCGAIEVASLLVPYFTFDELLAYARRFCMDDGIVLNEGVYRSESTTGDRNRAIACLLASKGVLQGDVAKCLDLYFRLCSLSVSAKSLAGFGLMLACGGVDPGSGERLLDERVVRVVKTLMLTCGLYDGSGEFAVKAGIPAKSGVGGGIMCSVENRMGIGSYGPSLDAKGNSIGGINMLEHLSGAMHLHIFDSSARQA